MKKFICPIACLVLISATTGCSLYEKIMPKKSAKETTTVQTAAENTPSNRGELADKIVQGSGAATDRQIPPVRVLPQEMGKVEKSAPAFTPLSETARVLGGSWTIIKVNDIEIDNDDNMPYVVFDPADGVFYANNGCNTINGSFAVNEDKIEFHNVLTTMRMCADVDYDQYITRQLSEEEGTKIKITENGSETFLEFISRYGNVVLRARRANLEFINGQWEISAVSGIKELKAPATVFFDLTDMKLHGNTGCNFFNGEIYVDHRSANAIDFSQLITTLRACEYPEQQTAILVALEETVFAISNGTEGVTLLNHDGQIMMELRKVNTNKPDDDK